MVALSLWKGWLGATAEVKPEQIFAVDLCFSHDDNDSDVSCVLLVQQRAKQITGGSNVSQPYNSPISIMDEGLPHKKEQSEEYVVLSKIIHIFLNRRSIQDTSQRSLIQIFST